MPTIGDGHLICPFRYTCTICNNWPTNFQKLLAFSVFFLPTGLLIFTKAYMNESVTYGNTAK